MEHRSHLPCLARWKVFGRTGQVSIDSFLFLDIPFVQVVSKEITVAPAKNKNSYADYRFWNSLCLSDLIVIFENIVTRSNIKKRRRWRRLAMLIRERFDTWKFRCEQPRWTRHALSELSPGNTREQIWRDRSIVTKLAKTIRTFEIGQFRWRTAPRKSFRLRRSKRMHVQFSNVLRFPRCPRSVRYIGSVENVRVTLHVEAQSISRTSAYTVTQSLYDIRRTTKYNSFSPSWYSFRNADVFRPASAIRS